MHDSSLIGHDSSSRASGAPLNGSKRRRVALIVETSNEYARGILYGLRAYIREHESWEIYLGEHSRGEAAPAWLARWDGDGIIARIENETIARAVGRSKRPTVDVSAARLLPDLPWVETNDTMIGRLALDHLLDRGFRRFGYCGDARFNWSRWRGESFAALVREAGHACDMFDIAPRAGGSASWLQQRRRLIRWVQRLPKPVGVFVCYDQLGQQLLEACRTASVAVPEEIAALGVDNDELLCDLADPPLSSVILDAHRTGYEAAALLDRMMHGQTVDKKGKLIAPLGIVTRNSTDISAIDDPEVAEAMRFIRRHACQGINVDDVLKRVTISRRILESRFGKLIGRSPHEEIVRVRLARVKELLTETPLSIQEIAHRTGFRHVEYLSAAFRKSVGVPPSVYRNQAGATIR